jgi:excisionase family DNA binding protein
MDIVKKGLNRKEAAKYLGISENTLVKAMKAGKVRFVRFGRSLRFLPEELNKLLASECEEDI